MIPDWMAEELKQLRPSTDNMPHYCGIPATEFSKDQLIVILASAMKDTERERDFHAKTRSMF